MEVGDQRQQERPLGPDKPLDLPPGERRQHRLGESGQAPVGLL
jgi:hypothetical protein